MPCSARPAVGWPSARGARHAEEDFVALGQKDVEHANDEFDGEVVRVEREEPLCRVQMGSNLSSVKMAI